MLQRFKSSMVQRKKKKDKIKNLEKVDLRKRDVK